jgi:hypothetical protein
MTIREIGLVNSNLLSMLEARENCEMHEVYGCSGELHSWFPRILVCNRAEISLRKTFREIPDAGKV